MSNVKIRGFLVYLGSCRLLILKATKPLKIIFDANPLLLSKSGVGYYTQELVQALSRLGHNKVLLVGYFFNFLGRKHLTNLPESTNIKYAQTRVSPGKILTVLRRLGLQLPLEALTKQKADIALFTNFVSLPTLTNTARVIAIYDLCFIDCPEYVSIKNRQFLQKWVPKSLGKADLIITISAFTKERIKQTYGLQDSKIHITPIPPAVKVKPDFSILEKHNISEGYILFVGTIEPRKNIIGLVNGYALLPEATRNKTPLVLAGGKGWHDEETLSRIKELQTSGLNIILTGYVSDAEKSALYGAATLCVQPSHYEGFGMPVLEAMSFGKPVTCSDIEVLREVAGDAAMYFDKDNPVKIAETIGLLLSSPDKLSDYAKRGVKRVATFPTWDEVAKDLYKTLNGLR